ncbi:hypothetical protein AMECASPLE_010861 [Ameca splendens]|uniref:Uncharacterized protein n=1 Tax=Ameca splendens TaxID=208324 RepID=A0ABV0ZWJ0_9TELE
MKCSRGAWRWPLNAEAWEAVIKAALQCQRENKKQAAVRRPAGRGLEMLHNSKSIQIKLLFRMERSICLTLEFNHLSLCRYFNDIIGNSKKKKNLSPLNSPIFF